MNDRFRFRVWSVREKEMIYNAEIAYDGTNYPTEWQLGENNNDGWICCFGEYINRQEDYKVMQCTGLKDKNGRLIYEGDIVKTEDNFIYKCVFQMNYGYGINSPCFMLTNEFGHAQSFVHDIEVIGNIHENPELLEDK